MGYSRLCLQKEDETWHERIRDKTFQNLGAPLNIKTVSDRKPDVPRTFRPFFPLCLKEKFSFLKKTASGNCYHKTSIHGSWLFKMSSFDNNQRHAWWFITNVIHFSGINRVYNVKAVPVDYHKGFLHKQRCFYLMDCYAAIKNPILEEYLMTWEMFAIFLKQENHIPR